MQSRNNLEGCLREVKGNRSISFKTVLMQIMEQLFFLLSEENEHNYIYWNLQEYAKGDFSSYKVESSNRIGKVIHEMLEKKVMMQSILELIRDVQIDNVLNVFALLENNKHFKSTGGQWGFFILDKSGNTAHKLEQDELSSTFKSLLLQEVEQLKSKNNSDEDQVSPEKHLDIQDYYDIIYG